MCLFHHLFFFSNTNLFLMQKRFMDLVKTKVDVDKTCQELKEQLGEMEVGQNLPEAAKRAIVKKYMKSPYSTLIRQELA